MLTEKDSRGYAGDRCAGNVRRTERCETGQTSTRIADPQLDAALEQMLGSEETLLRLIEASYESAEREAGLDPRSITRRITELQNRRPRIMDAYERGDYELPELRKRLGGIDAEIQKLRDFQDSAPEPIELEPGVVVQVAEVFASWRFLARSDKRDLLRAYRIRIHVSRPERRILHIKRVDIGSLGDIALYKKTRRYGIAAGASRRCEFVAESWRAVSRVRSPTMDPGSRRGRSARRCIECEG
jgi:hypothetical protein